MQEYITLISIMAQIYTVGYFVTYTYVVDHADALTSDIQNVIHTHRLGSKASAKLFLRMTLRGPVSSCGSCTGAANIRLSGCIIVQ